MLKVTAVTDTKLTVDVMAGDHIARAVEESIDLAKKTGQQVEFKFNGISIVVDKNSGIEERCEFFNDEMDRKRKEYQESQEYQESALRQKLLLAQTQEQVDLMMVSLDVVLSDTELLLTWIATFAKINDHKDLVFDKKAILAHLKRAGYTTGEYVDDPDIGTDKAKTIRWLVGEAMNHLEHDMPMHPSLSDYVRQCLELK